MNGCFILAAQLSDTASNDFGTIKGSKTVVRGRAGSRSGPIRDTGLWATHGLSKAPYGISRHRMAVLLKQPFMVLVDQVRVLRNPYGPRTSGLHTGIKKPVRHPQGPVRCPHVHDTEP